ncbi:MAG: DUF805 domain-containing protein [Pseudomonadota bacterium]
MEWMILPLKRYFEFSGRSRRKEYWMFVLFTVIVSIVLGILDEVLGLKFGESDSVRDNGVLGSIFSLATFIPSIAVAVRRLHDTDRSGWWLVVPVVAVLVMIVAAIGGAMGGTSEGASVGLIVAMSIAGISGLILLVLFCLDGTRGPNRFGDDPKGVAYEGVFD